MRFGSAIVDPARRAAPGGFENNESIFRRCRAAGFADAPSAGGSCQLMDETWPGREMAIDL